LFFGMSSVYRSVSLVTGLVVKLVTLLPIWLISYSTRRQLNMRISVSESWSALQRNMPPHIALFSTAVTSKVLYIVTFKVFYIVLTHATAYNITISWKCFQILIWISYSPIKHSFEECYLLGYNAVEFVESKPTFRKNISPPYLRMELKCSSETSVDFQGLHGVISQKSLHNHRCENLKSYKHAVD
jgi:hypothetical protein